MGLQSNQMHENGQSDGGPAGAEKSQSDADQQHRGDANIQHTVILSSASRPDSIVCLRRNCYTGVMRFERVYQIMDTAAVHARGGDAFEFLDGLIEGGARMVQFRHKGGWTAESFEILRRAAQA